MTKRIFPVITFVATLLLAAHAVAQPKLMSAHTDIHDKASLQRGAQLFFNNCVACHSLNFMRYSRMAEDLDLSEKEVMDNLNFTGAEYRETIVSTMPGDDAAKWLGQLPPDLSLTVNEKGADWVYSYLNSFYLDPERPVGWNNTVFPNASMPNILWAQQGLQIAKLDDDGAVESLELAQAGSMTPSQFHAATRDLTAFLDYVSEPAALQRHKYGPWVILFLLILGGLAWLLKREYWKDVH